MSAVSRTKDDLRDKLIFEKRIERQLTTLNKKLVNDFKKRYIETGSILDANEYRDDYESLLQEHYDRVGRKFSQRITPNLPEDVEITEDERDQIFEALNLFYVIRAGEQSLIITNTNQKEIQEAVEQAIIDVNDQQRDQQKAIGDRSTIATFAGTYIFRKFTARKKFIAITETQAIAEGAKLTEAEILAGLAPTITSRRPVEKKIRKEWVSVGDEKVRDTHVEADGQKKDITSPYEVGGQQMMYPGDTSLGATAKEIINCRCSSQVSEEEIIQSRRKAKRG